MSYRLYIVHSREKVVNLCRAAEVDCLPHHTSLCGFCLVDREWLAMAHCLDLGTLC